MTDTWGIPGPVFAGLYLGLLLLPALFAAVRALLLRRGRPGGAIERAEELALTTGGRPRVGEVVVVKLLEQRIVRLDGTGRLSHVRGTASDDLGRAALIRIGKHGASIDRVRDAVAAHPAMAELESAMIARGLVTDPRKARSTWVFIAAAYWTLVALGIVRLIAGTSTGHPVGYLLGLAAVGTVAAIVGTARARQEQRATATAAGRAAARRARTPGAGPAEAVASGGLTAHPDKDVRLAVTRATQRSTVRPSRRGARWAGVAGGGGYAGFHGGSSCGGGGSSCGGGGGGCGG